MHSNYKNLKIIKIVFFLHLLINIGCVSQDYKTSNYNLDVNLKKKLSRIVDSMYIVDQSNRKLYYKLDEKYGINKDSLFGKDISLKSALADNYKNYFNDYLNLIKRVKNSDSLNTLKLIQITKNYGFPNNNRLGKYKSKAYLIFVHSPKYFFKEIDELVDFEYKNNRISDYKRAYIKWHINGRIGLPPTADKNGNLVNN